MHVTIGSALDVFGGSLSYREVVAWSKAQSEEEGGARGGARE